MSLYLLHDVLIYWTQFAANGKLTAPDPPTKFNWTEEIGEKWEEFEEDKQFPYWGIPVVLVASLLLSWVLTVFVEEPARNWLKVKKPKNIAASDP